MFPSGDKVSTVRVTSFVSMNARFFFKSTGSSVVVVCGVCASSVLLALLTNHMHQTIPKNMTTTGSILNVQSRG